MILTWEISNLSGAEKTTLSNLSVCDAALEVKWIEFLPCICLPPDTGVFSGATGGRSNSRAKAATKASSRLILLQVMNVIAVNSLDFLEMHLTYDVVALRHNEKNRKERTA